MPSNPAESFPWYSGSGDDGTTGLLGDEHVPKYHPQPDACGTVDKASAALDLAQMEYAAGGSGPAPAKKGE